MAEQTFKELPVQEIEMSLWLLCNTASTKLFILLRQNWLTCLKDTTAQSIKLDSTSQKSNTVKKESRMNTETLPGYGGMESRDQISWSGKGNKKTSRGKSSAKGRSEIMLFPCWMGQTTSWKLRWLKFLMPSLIIKVCFQIPQFFMLSNRAWVRKVLPMA